MKRALVTGVSGFLGTWLVKALKERGCTVAGVDRVAGRMQQPLDQMFVSDLSSEESIDDFLDAFAPDVIFHLAGISFPPVARERPGFVLHTNAVCAIQFLEVLRKRQWTGQFLFASSSDVYGAPDVSCMPLREDAPLAAVTPYAASKIAAEMYMKFFMNDLDVTIVRPFNNIGPGQRAEFVLPAFLGRIAQARAGGQKSIKVGDLNAVRDFIDVRDLAQALILLAERKPAQPGKVEESAVAGQAGRKKGSARGDSVFNICSGRPVQIRELLETACHVAEVQLDFEVDPNLLRPEGADQRYGSADRLRALGWSPRYSLLDSVRDAWTDFQKQEQLA